MADRRSFSSSFAERDRSRGGRGSGHNNSSSSSSRDYESGAVHRELPPVPVFNQQAQAWSPAAPAPPAAVPETQMTIAAPSLHEAWQLLDQMPDVPSPTPQAPETPQPQPEPRQRSYLSAPGSHQAPPTQAHRGGDASGAGFRGGRSCSPYTSGRPPVSSAALRADSSVADNNIPPILGRRAVTKPQGRVGARDAGQGGKQQQQPKKREAEPLRFEGHHYESCDGHRCRSCGRDDHETVNCVKPTDGRHVNDAGFNFCILDGHSPLPKGKGNHNTETCDGLRAEGMDAELTKRLLDRRGGKPAARETILGTYKRAVDADVDADRRFHAEVLRRGPFPDSVSQAGSVSASARSNRSRSIYRPLHERSTQPVSEDDIFDFDVNAE
ncbi:hypothetical protein NKR23_g11978 [Pleurostoma richardsiae]|uniref:Uncharacterized protein n=1 Tax=Pleurostoma richardsiae TaxID=41990 RepID=A0AA38RHT4_9PEZI|nr:hypothetical protein NKR23_g11978 [Pleurostoma richardsiae]